MTHLNIYLAQARTDLTKTPPGHDDCTVNLAYLALIDMMKARHIKRTYHALCWGHPPVQFSVDAPIGRHTPSNKDERHLTRQTRPYPF